MTPAIPAVLLTLLACNLDHCGPTPKQSGDTILMVAPFVVLAAMGAQWLILRLWRRARPSLVLDWSRGLWLCGVLLFPAGYAFLTDDKPLEWLVIGFWLFGTSYLAISLVVMRIWLFLKDTRGLFFWTNVALIAVLSIPALPLALGLGGRELQDKAESIWIIPGFGGWVGGPLFCVLILEGWWRSRRALKLERSAETARL